MNIAQAIMHIYPTANPMSDFMVQDNGPEPVLRPGVDGRIRYEIKPPEDDEEPVEGVHYRYVVNYSNLVEGEDYDIVERGPYIEPTRSQKPTSRRC